MDYNEATIARYGNNVIATSILSPVLDYPAPRSMTRSKIGLCPPPSIDPLPPTPRCPQNCARPGATSSFHPSDPAPGTLQGGTQIPPMIRVPVTLALALFVALALPPLLPVALTLALAFVVAFILPPLLPLPPMTTQSILSSLTDPFPTSSIQPCHVPGRSMQTGTCVSSLTS